jgi:hypothetical protein
MPRMLAVRVVLVAFAVVTCTWFGLGIRQAEDQSRAVALMGQPGTPSAAKTAHTLQMLDNAGDLNPDRQIDLLRVQAEQRGGMDASAVRIAEAVVRAEPQNASAWVVLGFATERSDPALARLAHERVRELVPPVKAAH